MSNTNYITTVAKILDVPHSQLVNNEYLITKVRVEIPQRKKNKILILRFYDKLANDILDYYEVNDYILVNGFMTIESKNLSRQIKKTPKKQLIVTVFRIYPVLLTI